MQAGSERTHLARFAQVGPPIVYVPVHAELILPQQHGSRSLFFRLVLGYAVPDVRQKACLVFRSLRLDDDKVAEWTTVPPLAELGRRAVEVEGEACRGMMTQSLAGLRLHMLAWAD